MLLYKTDQQVAQTASLAIELSVNDSSQVLLLATQVLMLQLDTYKLRLRKCYMQSTIRMLRNLPLLIKNRCLIENTRSPIQLPFLDFERAPKSMTILFALCLRTSQNKDTNSVGLLKLNEIQGSEDCAANIALMRKASSQGDFCRKVAGRFESYVLENIPPGTKLANLIGIIIEFDCHRELSNVTFGSSSPLNSDGLNPAGLVNPSDDASKSDIAVQF